MSQGLSPATLITDDLGKPWWLFSCGQVVPWVGGAEGDDTDDSESDDDDNESDDDDKSNDDDSTDDSNDDKDKDDSAKLKERMKAADRRASQLQKERDALLAEKKKMDDAKKSELERARGRVEELEAETAEKDKTISNLRVQIAFFSVSQEKDMPKWIDPSEAVAALDLSGVEVSDDGKINKKQLRRAVKELAEQKKHWVAKEDDNDSTSSGASGSRMNGKRKGDKGVIDKDALAKDFPALKNRV